MQIGNRKDLDAARNALRDAFDAVWMETEEFGPREKRAVRCALALDNPRVFHLSPNWTILPGGRVCGQHNAVILA